MIKFIKDYISQQHEDYLLEIITWVLLVWWSISTIMMFIGLFTGNLAMVIAPLIVNSVISGYDRVMSYLTWKE